MASDPTVSDSGPFDISRIRQLVRLMRDNDLAEVDLRWENSRVRLRRGMDNAIVTTVAPAVTATRPAAPSAVPGATEGNESLAEPRAATAKASGIQVVSPIVGTFYTASSPDAEPFVRVGSKVTPETIVCIIEAMKVFNEIPAGVSGTVAELLVENGAAVEYGQPLYRIEP